MTRFSESLVKIRNKKTYFFLMRGKSKNIYSNNSGCIRSRKVDIIGNWNSFFLKRACFKSQVLLALKMKVYFGRRTVLGRQAYSSEIDIGNSTLFLQSKDI